MESVLYQRSTHLNSRRANPRRARWAVIKCFLDRRSVKVSGNRAIRFVINTERKLTFAVVFTIREGDTDKGGPGLLPLCDKTWRGNQPWKGISAVCT